MNGIDKKRRNNKVATKTRVSPAVITAVALSVAISAVATSISFGLLPGVISTQFQAVTVATSDTPPIDPFGCCDYWKEIIWGSTGQRVQFGQCKQIKKSECDKLKGQLFVDKTCDQSLQACTSPVPSPSASPSNSASSIPSQPILDTSCVKDLPTTFGSSSGDWCQNDYECNKAMPWVCSKAIGDAVPLNPTTDTKQIPTCTSPCKLYTKITKTDSGCSYFGDGVLDTVLRVCGWVAWGVPEACRWLSGSNYKPYCTVDVGWRCDVKDPDGAGNGWIQTY